MIFIEYTRNVIKCSTEAWTAYLFKRETYVSVCLYTWLDKSLQEMILHVHFIKILFTVRISVGNKENYYEFKPISI